MAEYVFFNKKVATDKCTDCVCVCMCGVYIQSLEKMFTLILRLLVITCFMPQVYYIIILVYMYIMYNVMCVYITHVYIYMHPTIIVSIIFSYIMS